MVCLWLQGLQKKMHINLTLMTLDREPCRLVLMWLMTLPSEPCHTGGMFNKKDGQKSYPIDFRSGAMSVGPDVVNDSPFRALSHWWHVYKTDRQNLTLITLNWVPIWLMALPAEHCHTGGVFIAVKCRKKTDRT